MKSIFLLFNLAILSVSVAFPPEKQHTNVVPFEKLPQALAADFTKSSYCIDILPHLSKINNGDTVYFDITLPETWKNREVFIVFEGKTFNFSFYTNNQMIGIVSDTHNLAERRVTKFVKSGINSLKFKALANENTFFQAYIYSTPKLLISNYVVQSELDGSFTNGILDIIGEVRNLDKRDYYKYSIEFALYDAKGKLVFSEQSPAFSFGKSKNKTKGINYNRKLPNVQKWSLSNPYLYTLIINMRDGDDNSELEILSRKIAFRSVLIGENTLNLNGENRPLNALNIELDASKIKTDSVRNKIHTLKKTNRNVAFFEGYIPALWHTECLINGLILIPDTNYVYKFNADSSFDWVKVNWADTSKKAVILKNINIEFDREISIANWELRKESKTIQSSNFKIDFQIGESKLWQLPENVLKLKDLKNLKLFISVKFPIESFWHGKNFILQTQEMDFTKP